MDKFLISILLYISDTILIHYINEVLAL